MKNPRVSRRKQILKITAEINAKETKETIAKINKAKSWFFEEINKIDRGSCPNMADEWNRETTFSPTNPSKGHLNIEQLPQNNF